MNQSAPEAKLPSIGDYYSATQLRADRWSALREAAESLTRHGHTGKRGAKLVAEAEALLVALDPIERYWAFPGYTAFSHMKRMLGARTIPEFAFAARRVARALATGAYRRRAVPLTTGDADADVLDDDASLSPSDRALGRPYFEVIIVDHVSDAQEKWLRSSLLAMRRPEDNFAYEAVVVPSLEDALIGILFNHNVQAVVVRPGLALKSLNKLKILNNYLSRFGEEEDVDALEPGDYGPETCRLIAKVRPELDTYLVTDRSAEDIAGLDLGGCRRVFYNQEDFLELHLNILRGVNRRYKTPFSPR